MAIEDFKSPLVGDVDFIQAAPGDSLANDRISYAQNLNKELDIRVQL